MTEQQHEAFRANHAALRRFARRYRADPALRARLAAGDRTDLHVGVPAGIEVRVVEQVPEVHYFLMPADPNTVAPDRALESVAGGSTGGTLGTVGSLGSVPSTASSAGTVGSVSSAS